MKRSVVKPLVVVGLLFGGGSVLWFGLWGAGVDADQRGPRTITSDGPSNGRSLPGEQDGDATASARAAPTMASVLEQAAQTRRAMVKAVDDYTTRFVKQERDPAGVLGEPTEIFMKVQTRHRGGVEDKPMRVYLRFDSPGSVRGREVIWGEDLYDGQLQVREAGILGSMMTARLDPNGFLAMQGQRYPISQIGMTNLIDKLLERGGDDVDDPDITVVIADDQDYDNTKARLVQVRRARPSGREEDFSIAEIVIDPERQLILSYRSYGWPTGEAEEPPLLESYAFHDVRINVGLTDADFDTSNPAYTFP